VGPLPGTLPGARYADFALSPDGAWLACVEECPRPGAEPANRLVVLATRASERRAVEEGYDFVSSPRFAPDGRSLAFVAWRHPNMPWDGTDLLLVPFAPAGPAGAARRLAGGPRESVVQPRFSPAGELHFVSDRSGWWNLYRLRGGEVQALCLRPAEFAPPPWVLGQSSYAFLGEDALLCARVESGVGRLARLELASGRLHDLELPFTVYHGIDVEGGVATFVAGGPEQAETVYRLELADRRLEAVREGSRLELPPGLVSRPEALEFPSAGGRSAHAFLYRPRHPGCTGPPDERPPLLVRTHGGPTSATAPVLRPALQYWTSRGFAVVDVNYGGSTGYGRAYRERLDGQWGIVDVEDCLAAARALARLGLVDPRRLVISGGSAGGYTTLCALTFHDLFAAGASHYGVGDLEALARETHKFESRYLERLVGPYPERRDLYRARSPLHCAERLARPVVFFQGLEDRVVPPAQAEAMVQALARRGIPHAYVAFPGEQHGFRRAESQRLALDGELWFYAQVLGFDVEPKPEAVRLRAPAPRRA
jgi:dipeptidyl aminopeptidase/acylaminoacyl peptidase